MISGDTRSRRADFGTESEYLVKLTVGLSLQYSSWTTRQAFIGHPAEPFRLSSPSRATRPRPTSNPRDPLGTRLYACSAWGSS